MKIRQLRIRNFRGIRQLDWIINSSTVCLIGPGDSTKSTILDAIEYALSSRWNITFSDTDFYQSQVNNPIEIVVTVGELPDELLSDQKFGLVLQGWNQETGLKDQLEDNDELVLSIKLYIDSSLEPSWTIIANQNIENRRISSRDRELLGVARLGKYLDRHLSWGRGSALTRVTGNTDEVAVILAEASRSARGVITNANLTSLQEAADRAQTAARSFGVTPSQNYQPALDPQSVTGSAGGLSLHEGDIPARLAGLGTRRLLALALQHDGVRNGAILLIDEVEQGLEPHRLRHLLYKLRSLSTNSNATDPPLTNPLSGQSFMTTHSYISIVELLASDLHVVRSINGETTVHQVSDELQATIRSAPEALLGRKIIVCEGKTEFGMCRMLGHYWASQEGGVPLATLGVVPVDGGGSNASTRAHQLRQLGYNVAFFGDSDRELNPSAEQLVEAGVKVVQWADESSTEQRVCNDLPWSGLKQILQHGIELRGQESVFSQFANELECDLGQLSEDMDDWLSDYTEAQIRETIANVSNKKGKEWFKRVDRGEELGKIIVNLLPQITDSDLAIKLHQLRIWAYDN